RDDCNDNQFLHADTKHSLTAPLNIELYLYIDCSFCQCFSQRPDTVIKLNLPVKFERFPPILIFTS
ncbi:MAG TPA: hypothetical protein PLW50_06000, partial [Smithellaceae bacterium]|nr:hypothetical protein [Smithellaceae bacterium]